MRSLMAVLRRSSATAWASRRLTTAGVAPMSLIETRTPASAMARVEVAQHRLPDRAEAARRGLHVERGSRAPARGSSSTSRLPEPTTPTSTGAKAPAGACRRIRSAGFRALQACSWVLIAVPHQLRKRSGGWYSPPEASTRSRIERAASRLRVAIARVDAEVLGAPDDAAVAQVLDHAPVARQADRGVAGDAADRLLALLVAAAQQQVGDAFLGQDVASRRRRRS